jgi:hypothetical protein
VPSAAAKQVLPLNNLDRFAMAAASPPRRQQSPEPKLSKQTILEELTDAPWYSLSALSSCPFATLLQSFDLCGRRLKWRKHGYPPWKFLMHLLLALLVIAQVCVYTD